MLTKHHRCIPIAYVQKGRDAPCDRFLCTLIKEVEERTCINVLVRSLRERQKRDVKDIPDEEWNLASITIAVERVTQVDEFTL
jgi:hypothetical protein